MIVEAPQPVLDRIVDRLIEESTPADGLRWVFRLDACDLHWRRRHRACPCIYDASDLYAEVS